MRTRCDEAIPNETIVVHCSAKVAPPLVERGPQPFNLIITATLIVSAVTSLLSAPLTQAHALYQVDELPTNLRGGCWIRLYDLRHTAASLLHAAGVPVRVISEMLGYSTTTLTLDTYSHLVSCMRAQAADTMQRVLAGK